MFEALATEIEAGLATASALGLAAGGCAYAALWPGSSIFGSALIAPRAPGQVALTFDDGPNPVFTPQLLDALELYGVRATFFLVGNYAQAEPELTRRIAQAGHLIGNHSWSHPNLALLSAGRIRQQLSQTNDALEQILGSPVRFFRPPFGARRPAVFRAARELSLQPVLWNAMTTDWSQPSADHIAVQLLKKVDNLERQGWAANIVLHDGSHLHPAANRAPSVSAAIQIVKRLGPSHRFVTLDEWS